MKKYSTVRLGLHGSSVSLLIYINLYLDIIGMFCVLYYYYYFHILIYISL